MVNFNELTKKNDYAEALKTVLRLSRLFSDNMAAPYLHYRISENLFCEFIPKTTNLGRDDIAIDAKTICIDDEGNQRIFGVGNKTFLHSNGNTLQKVAEFNKDRTLYENLTPREKIKKIAELRNIRLQFCIDNHGLTDLIYHCVTRDNKGIIRLYNTPMDLIDIDRIRDIKVSEASISFKDGKNDYTFNLSKSTLFKRFEFNQVQPVKEFKVYVDENPLETLVNAFNIHSDKMNVFTEITDEEYIVLPLYSFSTSKGKFVPKKSALNAWNAAGRERDPNEAYISISRKIHTYINRTYNEDKLKFFPDRDTPFMLKLPNGSFLNAKICQENSKALMTNPNKALGEWILRTVLKLKEGEILTYKKLQEIGIDSIKITQLDKDNLLYAIDFCSIGTYDEFAMENNI